MLQNGIYARGKNIDEISGKSDFLTILDYLLTGNVNIMARDSIREKITKLRLKGYSVKEIKNELQCALSTVSYHINKIGLGGNRSTTLKLDVDEEVISKIFELKHQKLSYKEILKQVPIGKDRLKKICKVYEINFPIGFKEKQIDTDVAIQTYLIHKSLRKASKELNVSRDTLRRFIPDDVIIVKKERKISKSKAVVDWRKRTKKKLVEYKGGKCSQCEYDKTIEALQFHHIDPMQKDFTIGGKSWSFERLKKEVDKCILLCANCHIEKHIKIGQVA